MRPLIFMLIALAAAPAPAAFAQGTGNTLPDPITGANLTIYAQRLELSPQQRLAIDAPHETYLAAFAELREREIEKFLGDSSNLMRRFWSSPDSREVRSALNDYDRLRGRIKALDEQLFGEIQVFLSEDQIELMPIVRQRRERTRMRSGLSRAATSANAASRTDLSVILDGIEVPPPARRAVEPLVNEYERRLTAGMRKVTTEARRMIIDVVKQLEDHMAEESNSRRRQWSFIAEIWSEEAKDVNDAAADISDLNWRSLRDIAQLLPAEPAVLVRRAYLARAYSELGVSKTQALDRYDLALRTRLDDDLRGSILAARTDFRGRNDRIVDEMVEITRRQRRESTLGGFGGRRQASPETKERLGALGTRRSEVMAEAAALLVALLGEERVAALGDDSAAPADGAGTAGAAIGSGVAAGARATAANAAPHLLGTKAPPDPGERYVGPDPFLPGPITAEEMKWYATLATMDGGDVAVLETLHDGYLERWEELSAGTVEAVTEAASRIARRSRRDPEATPTTTDDVDRAYDLRRRAMSSIRSLDDAFFADVEIAILGDDASEDSLRLRRARDRIVYRHGSTSSGRMQRWRSTQRSRTGREAQIDLVLLAIDGLLDTAGRAKAAPALSEYERDLAETLKERYELRVERARTSDRLRVEYAGQRGGRARSAYSTALADASAQISKRLAAVDERLTDLNRAGLAALAEALSPADSERVRARYRAAVHPEVYDDPRAVEPAFLAVFDLADLSDEQRVTVGEIFAEYRGTYGSVCSSMTDVLDEEQIRGQGPERWQRQAERRNRFDKLRFDRDELNDKTLRRLRAALTEEQLQRLGLGTG
ncbi:MAG: hypothetical protein GY715_12820 [Planctomycetes bacterium]|nr:hypothetical protein [Planctomycetota bacterium]